MTMSTTGGSWPSREHLCSWWLVAELVDDWLALASHVCILELQQCQPFKSTGAYAGDTSRHGLCRLLLGHSDGLHRRWTTARSSAHFCLGVALGCYSDEATTFGGMWTSAKDASSTSCTAYAAEVADLISRSAVGTILSDNARCKLRTSSEPITTASTV